VSVAAFIGSQRTEHGVPHAVACRALGVSESWFYKWRDRLPTPRQQRRERLADAVRAVFDASGGTYGSPRVTLELRAAGWRVSENTVARLMVDLGLAGRAPKPRRRSLTRPGKRRAAPDRLVKANSTGRRNTSINLGVSMGRPAGWMKALTGRSPMKSPGAPALRRDVERLFWREIARGLSSEDAALAVGVSQPVGSRWFRQRGGMPLFMVAPVTGRYLSFPERVSALTEFGSGGDLVERRRAG
jgi:hypothetical protein